MEHLLHQNAASFLEVVGPFLEEREQENSLILGLALSRLEEELAGEAHDPIFFAHLGPAIRPDAALMMTAPYPLLIAPITDNHSAIVEAAVVAGLESGLVVEGVTSSNTIAELFADQWSRAAGDNSTHDVVRLRLYGTRSVADTPIRTGALEPARPEHFAFLVDWFRAFHHESLPSEPEPDYPHLVGLRIEHGTVFVWMDGDEPLGMAGSTRPTRKTICVNAVYTPPEHRGNGVATSCVSSLTRLLLREFESCVLFTDLGNPTSNAIYQRIGYVAIQDSTRIRFG